MTEYYSTSSNSSVLHLFFWSALALASVDARPLLRPDNLRPFHIDGISMMRWWRWYHLSSASRSQQECASRTGMQILSQQRPRQEAQMQLATSRRATTAVRPVQIV